MGAIEVNVTFGVFVGAGVIGEYLFGFCVAVERGADTNVGNVCAGALAGGTTRE